jgi:hypothetical protein
MRHRWWFIVVGVAASGGIVVLLIPQSLDRAPRPTQTVVERPRSVPASQATKPLAPVPGVDVPCAVTQPYVDNATGHLITANDCDGDGLPDDWEMARYGTLKYDAKTIAEAPRIDLPPRKVDPKDTDGRGLPNAWQMKYFGSLGHDPHDDPAGDGFDNQTKYHMGLDPTKPHLVEPARKPKTLVHRSAGSSGGVSLFQTVEFWEKQDRLRAKLAGNGSEAASQPATAPAAKGGPQ